MRLLDLTLPTAAENVALDDALLEQAEASQSGPSVQTHEGECLRLWESPAPAVVLGRSSRIHEEVNVFQCHGAGAEIVRRASGGATIVAGPGCLMYAVVLSYRRRPQLRGIDAAHAYVLGHLLDGLRGAGLEVERRGTSDLTLGPLKFSGNSMRCRRDAMLYHGTLLYDFPIDLVGKLLKMPPRQPQYRQQRSHREFITNVPVDGMQLRQAIAQAFDAKAAPAVEGDALLNERVAALVAAKYGDPRWTHLL